MTITGTMYLNMAIITFLFMNSYFSCSWFQPQNDKCFVDLLLRLPVELNINIIGFLSKKSVTYLTGKYGPRECTIKEVLTCGKGNTKESQFCTCLIVINVISYSCHAFIPESTVSFIDGGAVYIDITLSLIIKIIWTFKCICIY